VHQFEDGATLGQKGSESGVILRDEEHPQEARITLERDTRTAPFAITCGSTAACCTLVFQPGKRGLQSVRNHEERLVHASSHEEEGGPEGCRSFLDGVAQFVQTYP